jgi:coiled-coil domain-containing protein 63/114
VNQSRFCPLRLCEPWGCFTAVDKYAAKTDVERRNTEQLTKQIDALKQRILEQRKDMHGVNAAKDNLAMVNKQIRILENRLDKVLEL